MIIKPKTRRSQPLTNSQKSTGNFQNNLQTAVETGIKVVDLLCPYQKGGKDRSVRWCGSRKTVKMLIQELISEYRNRTWWIFCIHWCRERTREGNDLYTEMSESGVIDKTAMVFGQMNEPPGAHVRRLVLQDLQLQKISVIEEEKDVLLFIDNIFRFTQAGSEVSALLLDECQVR